MVEVVSEVDEEEHPVRETIRVITRMFLSTMRVSTVRVMSSSRVNGTPSYHICMTDRGADIGFSVAPYGPNSGHTPSPGELSGRGGYTPPGRGRGRGRGFSSPFRDGHTPHTPQSGSATPVTGLGYHKGKQVDRSTGGKGGVKWGGGAAPLFVKAGELFKDGEVEVITIDSGMSSLVAISEKRKLIRASRSRATYR